MLLSNELFWRNDRPLEGKCKVDFMIYVFRNETDDYEWIDGAKQRKKCKNEIQLHSFELNAIHRSESG